MTEFARARVGDVLSLERRAINVDPAARYEEIGVRSFGKGIFHKEPVSGFDLGGKRVFRIQPGDLVISNVFAWEGAVASATPAEAGKIGSHRFMTFVPKDDRIDAGWAAWFFQSEPGLDLIRGASPGSAGRNRTLAIERFGNLEIPLLSLKEQRRVTATLDELRAVIDRDLSARVRFSEDRIDAFINAGTLSLLADLRNMHVQSVPLGEVGTWSSGGTPSAKEPLYYGGDIPWAVIGDLNDGLVTKTARMLTPGGLAESSARMVPAATVLIAMYGSIGKLGVAGTEMATNQAIACCQPTKVSTNYLVSVLRCLRSELVSLGQGGAQQNISQSLLKSVAIPLPDPDEQAKFVKRVASLLERQSRATELITRRRKFTAAVIPSAMNDAFRVLPV